MSKQDEWLYIHARDHVSKYKRSCEQYKRSCEQTQDVHTFNNGAVGKDDGFKKKIAYSKSMTSPCSNSAMSKIYSYLITIVMKLLEKMAAPWTKNLHMNAFTHYTHAWTYD